MNRQKNKKQRKLGLGRVVIEAGKSDVQGHLQQNNKLEASLGCKELCLKTIKATLQGIFRLQRIHTYITVGFGIDTGR